MPHHRPPWTTIGELIELLEAEHAAMGRYIADLKASQDPATSPDQRALLLLHYLVCGDAGETAKWARHEMQWRDEVPASDAHKGHSKYFTASDIRRLAVSPPPGLPAGIVRLSRRVIRS